MRVLPFGSATGENVKRLRFSWKIGVQVPTAPPAVERRRPPVLLLAIVAYTVFGSFGSNLTSLAVPGSTSENVAPPSVDAYTPSVGNGFPTAPTFVEFEASPRVPERVPMRMWFGSPGWTATHTIERLFATATEPGTRLQWLPSSVDL